MPDTNASYRPETRSEHIKGQIQKLERMEHKTSPVPTFDAFDSETEDLLVKFYGKGHQYVEAYKYAVLGGSGGYGESSRRGPRDVGGRSS